MARFRVEHGLADDEEHRRVWLAKLGTMIVPLPNFAWRRRLIAIQDAHHLIAGHAPGVRGELAVAAWELGVGCYRDWRARALCLSLAVVGLAVAPDETIGAWRAGRRARERYAWVTAGRSLLDLTRAAFV